MPLIADPAVSVAPSAERCLSARFPSLRGAWECEGLPRAIAIDNGPEFANRHLDDAARQVDFDVLPCPVRVPWFKGIVEGFFSRLNRQLLRSLPGTTFANVVERGDYDPAPGVLRQDAEEQALHHRAVAGGFPRQEVAVRQAALALDAEDQPGSANDESVLFVDDQDRQPHHVVVDPIEQAIHVELANIGVPVRAGSNLALLGGDALVGVDLFRLALDHTHQRGQADLADWRSRQRDVLSARAFMIASLDPGDDFNRHVGQWPGWALQPARLEAPGDDVVQFLAPSWPAAAARAAARQQGADVGGLLVPAQPGPQRPLADTDRTATVADLRGGTVRLPQQRANRGVAPLGKVAVCGRRCPKVRLSWRDGHTPISRRHNVTPLEVKLQAVLRQGAPQFALVERP
jgi:hypothetical protein